MGSLENRMGSLENRMAGLENRMISLENRMVSLETKIDTQFENLLIYIVFATSIKYLIYYILIIKINFIFD